MSQRKFQITKITYVAIFTALALLLNIYTVFINRYFALSFTAIPCMLAGIFLGPFAGFAVGFLGDLLGCLINPSGPILITVLISSGLLGFIPGMVFKFIKNKDIFAIIISSLLTLLICTIAINTTTFWFVYSSSKGTSWWHYLVLRLPWQTLVTVINAFIGVSVYIPLKKFVFKRYKLVQA